MPTSRGRRFVAMDYSRHSFTLAVAAASALAIGAHALAGGGVQDPPGCFDNSLGSTIGPGGPVCLIDPTTGEFREITYTFNVNVGGGDACTVEGIDAFFCDPATDAGGDPQNNCVLLDPSDFTLTPGSSQPFLPGLNPILLYTINPADIVGGTITARGFAFGTALTGFDDQAEASSQITKPVLIPELTITKDADTARICEGVPQDVTYTYEVCNVGNTNMTNIVVNDPDCAPIDVPPGQGPGDTLGVGGCWTFTCTTEVSEEVTNIASVTGQSVLLDAQLQLACLADEVFSNPVTVEVNPNPVCNIDGPDKVNEGETHEYCGTPGMDTYDWDATGDCAIDGASDTQCIDVNFTSGGSCTLGLDIVDENGCIDDCILDIIVNAPGACCIDPATEDCEDNVELEECLDLGGNAKGFFPGAMCNNPEVVEYCQELGACCIDPDTENCVDNQTATQCAEAGGEFFIGQFCDDQAVQDECQPEDGGEGCTPGFWMQPHHCGHWTCSFDGVEWGPYCPDGCPGGPEMGTLFTDVFNDTSDGIFAGRTLDDVLGPPGQMGFGPPALRILAFHTIAALLNAAHDEVAFGISPQDVIDNWNDAIAAWEADGNQMHLNQAKNFVADLNEQGCPLSGHADLSSTEEANGPDGYVNMTDLLFLLSHWGTSSAQADVNNDGVVDSLDLLQMLGAWGPQTENWATSLD